MKAPKRFNIVPATKAQIYGVIEDEAGTWVRWIDVEKLIDALSTIQDISVDYDGYESAEDLKKLIDELRKIAQDGVSYIDDSENFSSQP